MSSVYKKSSLIKELCSLLIADKKHEAISFSHEYLPFFIAKDIGVREYEKLVSISTTALDKTVDTDMLNIAGKRQYSKKTMMEVFRRDGFIDRYTRVKLLHPGILTILNLELPEVFKYHSNWKLGECHMVYWELLPTVDHIVPLTSNGSDQVNNLMTVSMVGNAKKSNTLLSKLGWTIHPQGDIDDWDGLSNYFIELMEKNKNYDHYANISKTQYQKLREWKIATPV